jgi:hypothetical protein
VDAKTILGKLPPFDGHYELIHQDQSVGDIIHEVQDAHKAFAGHYDNIALCFDADTVKEVCDNLYKFCKRNFTYDEQNEDNQMTMSPAAMIHLHKVDCKNYAGFCAGVLDGLNRLTQRKINWCYRFASYRFLDNTPHHVFVVVNPGGNEIWLDPTPGANLKNPVWQTDKKIKVSGMALNRVSGTSAIPEQQPVNDLLNVTDSNSPLYSAIQLLLRYGIMDLNASVNDRALQNLEGKVSPDVFTDLVNARMQLQKAAIGNLWDDIKFGVMKARFVVERNAFLLVLRMNGFGLASKLKHVVFADDAMTTHWQPGQDNIYRKWHSLGGDWAPLSDAIRAGARNKAILGGTGTIGGEPITLAAAVAAATAIIAALTPIIKGMLDQRKGQTGIDYNIDPTTGLPYGSPNTLPNFSSGGIMSFIENNPLIIIGGAVALMFLLKKKRTA